VPDPGLGAAIRRCSARGPPKVAEAFCAACLADGASFSYGTLPAAADFELSLARAGWKH
jgi:hypothetical protein